MSEASFPRGRPGQYYRGYTGGGSPLQQYCSTAASPGYHYQYSGHQTNGGGYRPGQGMQVSHQGGDQYGAYPGGYPGYYDQAQLSGGHQGGGASGGYYHGQGSGYNKSGFSEGAGPGYPGYPGEAKTSSGYYYPSCQGGSTAQPSDPATANTPLPPDFSYVGSSQGGHHGEQGGGYQDFYAMG